MRPRKAAELEVKVSAKIQQEIGWEVIYRRRWATGTVLAVLALVAE